MFNEITVDQLIEQLEEFKNSHKEMAKVTEDIKRVAATICDYARRYNDIVILTDYDADGICSAYILENVLKSINKGRDFHVTVRCNDPRESYGVPKNVIPEEDKKYIVLDMGSNELDYLRKTFGNDVIVIDHHIIETSPVRHDFRHNNFLLNPHCRIVSDGQSADYCTTGLIYRISQVLENEMVMDVKTKNAIKIMAGIGTIADCVNLTDENSLNYDIVVEAKKCLDNADENNIPFVLGYFLKESGLNSFDSTVKQIAFGPAPMLNAPRRMSSLMNENGAQMMYDTLTGPDVIETYDKIDAIKELNDQRKKTVNMYVNDVNCQMMMTDERNEDRLDSNVCVYLMPDDTPYPYLGLVAARISGNTDKACFCFAYDSQKQAYHGSARNVDGQTSLYKFVENLKSRPDGKSIQDIQFGGHDGAIGISYLKDAMAFTILVSKYADLMQSKPPLEDVIKLTSVKTINEPDFIKKVRQLEEAGYLKKYPCYFEGNETRKKTNAGKKVTLNINGDSKDQVDIKVSFYTNTAFPSAPTDKPGKANLACLAYMNVDNDEWRLHGPYRVSKDFVPKEFISFDEKYDRGFIKERTKQIERLMAKSKGNIKE